jgi:hypothetical protein
VLLSFSPPTAASRRPRSPVADCGFAAGQFRCTLRSHEHAEVVERGISGVLYMMKSCLFAAVVGALALNLAGCADQPSKTRDASTANPTDRTYTQKDLNHSGRQTTAEGVQALDPAVTTSSGR